MTHTFWLYSLLDAMVAANARALEGGPKEGAPKAKAAETPLPTTTFGGSGRLPRKV